MRNIQGKMKPNLRSLKILNLPKKKNNKGNKNNNNNKMRKHILERK